MIEGINPEACDRVIIRILYNGKAKDLFITDEAIEHCGGKDWFDQLCETYNLQLGAYDHERGGYKLELAIEPTTA